ncbi:DUF3035 domain-containing protein [Pseudooceanicola sp. C21-150M6]|uniref:DUF3035 domain-containing protein n=1 Tax=Pseudooceanicola sp. C21-150M6 TaxID=3434355 RepID=UPI003D7F7A50
MTAPNRMVLPALMAALMALSACGGQDGEYPLHNIRQSSNGPDEFTIVPNRPLEMPLSLTELPPPTPGQSNRTDLTPEADAVAALGGNPAAELSRGVGAGDGALVTAAGRRGVDPNIRTVLAEEDADFRKRQYRFRRLQVFAADKYYPAYKKETLDSQATKRLWRRAGAPTPTAPPEY